MEYYIKASSVDSLHSFYECYPNAKYIKQFIPCSDVFIMEIDEEEVIVKISSNAWEQNDIECLSVLEKQKYKCFAPIINAKREGNIFWIVAKKYNTLKLNECDTKKFQTLITKFHQTYILLDIAYYDWKYENIVEFNEEYYLSDYDLIFKKYYSSKLAESSIWIPDDFNLPDEIVDSWYYSYTINLACFISSIKERKFYQYAYTTQDIINRFGTLKIEF